MLRCQFWGKDHSQAEMGDLTWEGPWVKIDGQSPGRDSRPKRWGSANQAVRVGGHRAGQPFYLLTVHRTKEGRCLKGGLESSLVQTWEREWWVGHEKGLEAAVMQQVSSSKGTSWEQEAGVSHIGSCCLQVVRKERPWHSHFHFATPHIDSILCSPCASALLELPTFLFHREKPRWIIEDKKI